MIVRQKLGSVLFLSAILSATQFISYAAEAQNPNPAQFPARPIHKPLSVKKGEIPSDREYWRFTDWYLNHSVVSLIVNGEDMNHLTDVFRQVKTLLDRHVAFGQIIVVGGTHFGLLDPEAVRRMKDPKLFADTNPRGKGVSREDFEKAQRLLGLDSELPRLAEQIDLGKSTQLANVGEILGALDVENSPTWIVRYHGKNYIYEGVTTISRYFTNQGQFNDSAE